MVYLSTQKRLGYGPFTMRLSDLENGTERTAATYKVNYPFSVVKNIALFGGGLFGGGFLWFAATWSGLGPY